MITGIIVCAMASALVFAPGCSLDELPLPDDVTVPPTDEGSNTQNEEEDQGQAQGATPTAVSGEDPQIVPVYPGAVRTMYASDSDERAAVYAAPAGPDDIWNSTRPRSRSPIGT